MRYELKTISIWSVTKIAFFVNLVFGFLLGLVYAMMMPLLLLPLQNSPFGGPELELGGGGMLALLFIMPIMGALFCAVFQTIIVVVLAATYNLAARLFGGLEFKLDRIEDAPVIAQPAAGFSPAPLPATYAPPPPPPPPAPAQPLTQPEPPRPESPDSTNPIA